MIQLIGDKEAAKILFDTIAERFVDRPGGYTRILRLATPRLGDAGERAILEFVGKNDRVKRKSQKPAFEADAPQPADQPKRNAKIGSTCRRAGNRRRRIGRQTVVADWHKNRPTP